jgi:hypothetical protein
VDLTRASVTGRRSGNQEYPLRLLRGSDRTLTAERISEISEVSEAVQG